MGKTRNTGKASEDDFELTLKKLGKRAAYDRLVDASDLFGMNKRKVNTPPSPSDYLVTIDGEMFLAEVKSTSDKTAFRFSLLRPVQWGAALRHMAANGKYYVFVQRLPSKIWFKIPAQIIAAIKGLGKSSIPWTELTPYKWDPI